MPELSSQNHPKEWSYHIGLVFASVLAGVGAIGLINGIREFNRWIEVRSWAPTHAHITRASLGETTTQLGSTYEVTADYEISWNGAIFKSDRVAMRRPRTFDKTGASARVDVLKAAQAADEPVTCYINPHRPDESVLFLDYPLADFAFCLLTSAAFGSAGIWMFRRLRSRQKRRWQIAALTDRLPNQPWCWAPDRFEGRCPPIRRWPMILSVCLIWNIPACGLAVLLSLGAATQHQGLLWLASPALAVGVCLVFIAAQVIWLLTKYGEPTLVVRPWPLMLGDPLDCTLTFEEAPREQMTFNVWLEVSDAFAAAEGFVASSLAEQTVQIADGRLKWSIPAPLHVARSGKPFDLANHMISNWQIHVVDRSRMFGLHLIYDVAVFHCPDGA